MRILIAAILGGAMIFVWGFLHHAVLGLGHRGLRALPQEEAVLQGFTKANLEEGLYLFPGIDFSREPTEEEKKAYEEKYLTSPAGLLLYRPEGGKLMPPSQFIFEALSNILSAGVVAFVVSRISAGYLYRLLAVTSFGLVGWLSISVSYWNWYKFPVDFIGAAAIEQVVSWFLAGILIAAIVRPRRAPEMLSELPPEPVV